MERIIEEKGVRATINYEIIDEDLFNKHLIKKASMVAKTEDEPGYTADDYMAEVFIAEQAQKEFDSIYSYEKNTNEYSLIDIYIWRSVYKLMLDDFKSGKRKDDYEAHKDQQEYNKEWDDYYKETKKSI